jgi:Uncharacterized protein conserved in bacteria (DUF2188)
MAKDILHVVPHEQVWAVKREGNERASSTHETQKEAIEAARELAKERDDIIIHRADGTIRERVTYMGSNGASETRDGARHATAEGRPETEDLVGVGSRVSWGAVLAGVVVAVTTYFTLSFLVLAIGLSTMDRLSDRNFNITTAAVSAVILLVSMFVGGLVASRATAGENPVEGAAYGALVWGTSFILLAAGGLSFASSGLRALGPTAALPDAQRVRQDLGLTAQQAERYDVLARDARTSPDAEKLAWWTFAGVAFSLMSAIGGGIAGAGPELSIRARREPAAVIVPHPA